MTKLEKYSSIEGDGETIEEFKMTTIDPKDIVVSLDGKIMCYMGLDLEKLINLSISGNLRLYGCASLTSLPDNLSVSGFLDLGNCTSLVSLPDNLLIYGDLNLRGCTSLNSIPDNLSVFGFIITDLGGFETAKSAKEAFEKKYGGDMKHYKEDRTLSCKVLVEFIMPSVITQEQLEEKYDGDMRKCVANMLKGEHIIKFVEDDYKIISVESVK